MPTSRKEQAASASRRERDLVACVLRVDALERRCPDRCREVRSHEIRVARLAVALARELGCPPERRAEIFLAARLHDVGKLATPDAVLFKRGFLDQAERREMERHTSQGAEILARDGPSLPPHVLHAVLYHHERYDGLGYNGLRGEEIPFIARVIAVCDAFDALRADRAYKRGLDEGEALELMTRDGPGFGRRAFDPVLLRAFVAMRLREAGPGLDEGRRASLAAFAASDPQDDLPPDHAVTFRRGFRIVWAEADGGRRQAALISPDGVVKEIPRGPGLAAVGLDWAAEPLRRRSADVAVPAMALS